MQLLRRAVAEASKAERRVFLSARGAAGASGRAGGTGAVQERAAAGKATGVRDRAPEGGEPGAPGWGFIMLCVALHAHCGEAVPVEKKMPAVSHGVYSGD